MVEKRGEGGKGVVAGGKENSRAKNERPLPKLTGESVWGKVRREREGEGGEGKGKGRLEKKGGVKPPHKNIPSVPVAAQA